MSKNVSVSGKWSKSATMKLVYTAMFVAIAVVSNAYFHFNISPTVKYSFNLTVDFFAGAFLGGPLGFAVGAIGDLIGFIMLPDGSFNPVLTITEGVFCFIPGIIFQLRNAKITTKKPIVDMAVDICFIVLSFVLGYILCTVVLRSAGLWLIAYYKSNYATLGALMVARAVAQLPNTAINLGVSIVLFLALKRSGLYAKFQRSKSKKVN